MKKSNKQLSYPHVSLTSYVIGFCASLLLTVAAYLIVSQHVNNGHGQFTHRSIIIAIMVLALTQLVVQVVFFLHLGQGRDRQMNSVAFAFMILVVVVVAAGSIWIMNNLHYNMMTPQQTQDYIEHDEGIQPGHH